MEIPLDLGRNCIETAAKLKVESLIRSYFKMPDPAIEDRISALTRFLETADFRDLRTRISRLEKSQPIRPPNKQTAVLVMSKTKPDIEIRFCNQSIYLKLPIC